MARIVMADDGISFDGRTAELGPLGGAEIAFASLAEALADRGHDVRVRNNCRQAIRHRGVEWAPFAAGMPAAADLYIANRGHRLLALMPAALRQIFWIHNPASYLLKARYLRRLWLTKPCIVFSGAYHAATFPWWAPSDARIIIPYGIAGEFHGTRRPSPAPRAVFLSNPLRSLDWLLRVWQDRIGPGAPGAQFHLFGGAAVYGAVGTAKARSIDSVLDRARKLSDYGVVVRGPLDRRAVRDELRAARLLIYRGDQSETFCNAVAEAQAMGVPAVVCDVGCMRERVVDRLTGFVVPDLDQAAFAEAALRLLSDDATWDAQHAAALKCQGGWTWDDAAAAFERLLPAATVERIAVANAQAAG